MSNSVKAQKIAEVLRGWINYFKIGSILTVTRKLDTMLRYRFRSVYMETLEKHRKINTKSGKNLVLGQRNAARAAWSHGYARICRTEAVCYAMSNAMACKIWTAFCGGILCKSVKLTEPPDAEPHVRWCESRRRKPPPTRSNIFHLLNMIMMRECEKPCAFSRSFIVSAYELLADENPTVEMTKND